MFFLILCAVIALANGAVAAAAVLGLAAVALFYSS